SQSGRGRFTLTREVRLISPVAGTPVRGGWPVPGPTTILLQDCLDRWRAGDEKARDELIGRSCERLRRLTRTILHADFGRVRAAEETDDVLQTAVVRLMNALRAAP